MMEGFSFLEKIGIFALLIFLIHAISKIYVTLRVYYYGKFDLGPRLKKYGNWAVVTGCTRGCGEEFCRQLAALGFNLIMVARNEQLLNDLANEIGSQYKVKTCKVNMDLDQFPFNAKPIEESLKDKDVGILVNNAAVMVDRPTESHKIDARTLRQIITVNINALQAITFLVLEKSFLPKNRGLIVNLSSAGAHQPLPLAGPYAASKKYVEYMSEGLRYELLQNGHADIRVQVLDPMFICTGMTHYNSLINKPSIFSPEPKRYVQSALATFATTSICTGYFLHTLQVGLTNYIPQFARAWGSGKLMAFLGKEKKL